MRPKQRGWPTCLLLAGLLCAAGCASVQPAPPPLVGAPASGPLPSQTPWQVTRVVPHEVLHDVPVTADSPSITIPLTPTPAPPRPPCPLLPPAALTAAGVMAAPLPYALETVPALLLVTQFYTLLDRGLYADAYHLVSAAPELYGLERPFAAEADFTARQSQEFGRVCLYDLRPLAATALPPGRQPAAAGQTAASIQEVAVWLTASGPGTPEPAIALRRMVVGVVQQADGQWRILYWHEPPSQP